MLSLGILPGGSRFGRGGSQNDRDEEAGGEQEADRNRRVEHHRAFVI